MDRPRRVLSAEPLVITLIAVCVIATLATVIAVHQRPPRPRSTPVVVAASAPEMTVVETSTPPPTPIPPPPPPKPAPAPIPDDPTKPIVAELAKAEATQRLETTQADQRIALLAAATRLAKADTDRWKRNLALTRSQLDARAADARRRESQVGLASMERDALARRRDTLKTTLQRDQDRPSYAVLPHKGPNGTWQRPIVLECKDESVTLRPKGATFGLLDLHSAYGTRTNPFVAMISREAIRIQRQAGPNGADITPYIFFIIRPDGVRAYYEARTRLERLGIAFGYELADADWAIDVPDLDHPATWDGSPPPVSHEPEALTDLTTPRGDGSGKEPGSGRGTLGEIADAFTWPKGSPGMDRSGSQDSQGGLSLTAPRSDGSGRAPGSGHGSSDGLADGFNRSKGSSGTEGQDSQGALRGSPLGGSGTDGTGQEHWSGLGSSGVLVEGTNRPKGPSGAEAGNGSGSQEGSLSNLRRSGGPGQEKGTNRGSAGDIAQGFIWPKGGSDTDAEGGHGQQTGSANPRDSQLDANRVTGAGIGRGSSEEIWNRALAMSDPSRPAGLPRDSAETATSSGGDAQDGGTDSLIRPGFEKNKTGTLAGRTTRGKPRSLATSDRPTGLTGQPGAGFSSANPDGADPQGQGMSGTGTGTGANSTGSAGQSLANSGQAPRSGTGSQGTTATGTSSSGTAGTSGSSGAPGNTGSTAPSGSSSPNGGTASGGSSGMAGDSPGGVPSRFSPASSKTRPIELVISSSAQGVSVHPGNYRVTLTALKSKDEILVAQLKAIVVQKQRVDPDTQMVPSIRYVIEAGGHETYATAKSQIMFSGLDWPSSLQVSGSDTLRLFSTDAWK